MAREKVSSGISVIQGSDEWHQARLGKVTASRVADVIARTKSGWGASRANYMAELIAERLSGVPAPSYTNDAMRWGIENEADARAAYEFFVGSDVQTVGFIDHPTIPMSGASPDGLVGADGLLELKCPLTATHIDTLLNGTVAAKYVTQMQWQMACTGRSWCDFASFDPRMPERMRLFVKRFPRDDKTISELEAAVKDFLDEIDGRVEALTKKYAAPANMLMAG
jgi:putative phage-type endonuclease